MATYSAQELSEYYGVSKSTFERHLKILRDTNKFQKTSIGSSFNEIDASKIAMLLGFSLPKQPIDPPTFPSLRLNFK